MPDLSLMKRLALASIAFINTYRAEYLSPAENAAAWTTEHWDDYEARLFRYLHYSYYYSNKAYSKLVQYAAKQRSDSGLYKYVRAIYNPVYRLVELETAKAYGGAVDWEKMQTGAIPFDKIENRHRDAIRNLWKWSNIGSFKTRYPRDCARFGDALIKVVDDPFKAKVRLELIHPGIIADAEVTPQGFFNWVWIAYQMQDEDTGRLWLYEEEITKEHFATYRDGEPYALYTDATGKPITEWANPYGFVPVVLARAIELEHSWGAAPFFPTLDKIDQVNDLASITFDQIRKGVNAIWWLEGVSSMQQIAEAVTNEDTERDKTHVMLGPVGSRPSPMVANVDISAALNSIQSMLEEIESDFPELSLNRLRGGERVTSPGTLTAYDDAINRIIQFRSAVDSGLLRAHQMALSIGGFRKYPGFEPFNLDSYDAGDLDFEIADRPVLRDTLTQKERVDFMLQSKGPNRWVWQELGKSDEEIEEAERELEERREQMQEQLSQGQPSGGEQPNAGNERGNQGANRGAEQRNAPPGRGE